MKTRTSNSTALATVCTDDFLAGTMVMLSSFKEYNPWFDGDIIVIHDTLSAESIEKLNRQFDNLQLLRISELLNIRLNMLMQHYPKLQSRRARFYSLESFSLHHYDKLLFVDSDILFTQSVKSAFENDAAFSVCPDASYFRKKVRDTSTFEEISKPATQAINTFNAGFMLTRRPVRTTTIYQRLLDELSPERWRDIKTGHTDQFILNRHFNGKVALLSSRFNYLLGHDVLFSQNSGIDPDQAAVLHYNGPTKPWHTTFNAEKPLSATMIDAIKRWRSAHRDLVDQHSISP